MTGDQHNQVPKLTWATSTISSVNHLQHFVEVLHSLLVGAIVKFTFGFLHFALDMVGVMQCSCHMYLCASLCMNPHTILCVYFRNLCLFITATWKIRLEDANLCS